MVLHALLSYKCTQELGEHKKSVKTFAVSNIAGIFVCILNEENTFLSRRNRVDIVSRRKADDQIIL